MRRIFVVVALILATLCSTAALADEAPPPAQQATVVKKIVKRPPRVVHRRAKLHLPAKPTVAQVQRAIRREAAMWGVSAAGLSRRVACESHYHWWASNGQYQGVLQFAPGTFYRGLGTIRTRRVIEVSVRTRRMHSRVYRHWSDGKITRSKGRIVRQTVVVTRRGMIPKKPSVTNVDAQLRIGAQALRGISAVHSSEWACGA
jgi:hypothetical protein